MIKERNNYLLEDELKFAIDNGMINVAFVQEQMKLMKRKEILENHKPEPWLGNDGYWHTYLPDKEKGRKPVKRKKKEDVDNAIVEYWNAQSQDMLSFKKRFDVWVERQRLVERSDNTIHRYLSDYNKCFAGYPIETKLITDIKDEDIYKHLKAVIKKENVTFKRIKSLFGYIKGVYTKSIIDKLIKEEENPCRYVDIETLKPLCREENSKNSKQRTISTQDAKRVLEKMRNPNYRNKHPNLVAYKAIEFAMLTGMRVGELSGLKWEDIDYEEGYIVICHSEKYSRVTKEYSVKSTKNKKIRYLPITDDIYRVLEETKKLEMKNGWLGDFVFMNENGRVHCRIISDCIRNLSMTKDFNHVSSIHEIRRTVNSKMRCNGVTSFVASALVGNSKPVNDNFYSYNVEEYEKQKKYVQEAGLL